MKSIGFNAHPRRLKTLIIGCFFLPVIVGAQLPSYVPASNLLGFWLFNGNANDLSGNNNNGLINGATPSTDRFSATSAAYQYNGTSDYITVPDQPMLSDHHALSISAWILPNSFSGVQGIVTKWYQVLNCSSHSDTYEGALQNNFVQFATNNNNLTAFTSPPALSPGDLGIWKHIVWMSDSLLGQFIYINGSLAASFPVTGKICASVNPIYFGADYDGKPSAKFFHRFFNGKIDDVGLWSRLLSDCEIKQLYYASLGTLSASANKSVVCQGTSVILTATGALSYTWMPAGTGPSITATPVSSTVYTVTGQDSLIGCLNSSTVQVNVSDCVGLKDVRQEYVRVYPNPAAEKVTVKLEVPAQITVINALGELIESKPPGSKEVLIDMTGYQPGIYFIQIKEQGNTITRKVIKK